MSTSILQWTIHPLTQAPKPKSALLILIILTLSFSVALSFQSLPWGLLTLALLTVAMSRYFLPTHYACNNQGITISHLGTQRQIPWTSFRRFVPQPDGVFLSPFTTPHRLDAFRGHFIRFHNNRDEVLHVIQTHISPNAS